MAPRSRQKNTAQEPPPAPEDPALGMRTHQGRSAGAGASNIPLPPTAARTASSGDQARGFGGLSGMIFIHGFHLLT